MALLSSLARHGYAVVQPSREAAGALRQALLAWRDRGTFRHPPVPDDVHDDDAAAAAFPDARGCFNALFGVCRDSLRRLDREWQAAEGAPLGAPLHELPAGDVFLPSPHAELPFEGIPKATVFDESFFNLFNYDHGSLNPHVDRGLITIVYGFSGGREGGVVMDEGGGDPEPEPAATSRLWVRDLSTGRWRDAEAACAREGAHVDGGGGGSGSSDRALLFAGERLEQLTAGKVRAVEHCVRVDPDGAFLNRSHHTRDPAAAATGNRLSAAMIFSYAEEDRGR